MSRLAPGMLWQRAAAASRRALELGALTPIETETRVVEDAGVRFVVRVVRGLGRKPFAAAVGAAQQGTDPFLPYDEELLVAEVSDSHVCLLNKFLVIEHHVLLVTRAWADQEELLDLDDLTALWICLDGLEGLAFYNGGRAAGASQPHKHLQIVPLPLADGGPAVPVEPLLDAVELRNGVGRSPRLPFRHAFARLDAQRPGTPERTARATLELLAALFRAAGMPDDPTAGPARQSGPYNLLLTPRWILLVPRSRESFGSISVNALGFAGALLARDARQRSRIESVGPLTLLRSVGVDQAARA